jgi:hypothetical protein
VGKGSLHPFITFRLVRVINEGYKRGSLSKARATVTDTNDLYPRHGINRTAKTKCRKFETNIPRKGISGYQSQFPHSCVCERIKYSRDGSAFSAGGNMWTDPGNI